MTNRNIWVVGRQVLEQFDPDSPGIWMSQSTASTSDSLSARRASVLPAASMHS